ncbi:class I SAM-dependent methyltransferase [Pseudanabaena sp. UWO310]|uniref:class I SAM-dependent methyltransferase n=1 Tax=Pseudanabaena sp. UWO310 TaxID=2480795 RepID=UPI001159A1D6|nr:class I SAM-dependent methyltransferase [Pseudanabaena sp. UWO310]TYQ25762.1 class I SAM-dependent methyltransferase [Pseudanabaena sp. UWO310]
MLSFDDFKKLANDPNLSPFEKVGFAAPHRQESEQNIFPDILSKISLLNQHGKTVLDIGCGCSLPTFQLIDYCKKMGSRLVLVDSEEMLSNLPDDSLIEKSNHEFPHSQSFIDKWSLQVDVIICYSVIHHIYLHQNLFTFIDKALSLLRDGGQMLIGDIPNFPKKKRFLSSEVGKAFHKKWSGEESPQINWLEPHDQIDDSLLIHLMLRYRSMGMETYLLPQKNGLPLNNTREDLLICKY